MFKGKKPSTQKHKYTWEWALLISVHWRFCIHPSIVYSFLWLATARALSLRPSDLLQDFVEPYGIDAIHAGQCFALLLVV